MPRPGVASEHKADEDGGEKHEYYGLPGEVILDGRLPYSVYAEKCYVADS